MEEAEVTQGVEVGAPNSEAWIQAIRLPSHLSVELSVPEFTVGDLLRLDLGSVVDTQKENGARVPIKVNGLVIGWGEFDAVGDRLVVRLVELV